jgi:threonine dehydrogenase-like Zn-dependent dehydrogenase
MVYCCRKGGTLSLPGVYIGMVDKFPLGAFMNKGLTMKSGQTHMQRYMKPLLERVEKREIDPSFLITHKIQIEDTPEAYKTFRDEKDTCIKVVIKF